MNKILFKKLFELSRLSARLPKNKSMEVVGEIVDILQDGPISKVPLWQVSPEENFVAETLKSIDFKMKLARILNTIPNDPESDVLAEKKISEMNDFSVLGIEDMLSRVDFGTDMSAFVSDREAKKKAEEEAAAKKKEALQTEERLEALVSGTYHMEGGKLVKGRAPQRTPSTYTNWTAGNVDPQDLEKHKALLHRQYFGGPFWEGKSKPKPIEQELPFYNPILASEEVGYMDCSELPKGEQTWKRAKS